MEKPVTKSIGFLKAFVLTGRGTDQISLTVELPNAIVPSAGDAHAHFRLEATARTGADWVRRNIGLEPEVVDLSRKPGA